MHADHPDPGADRSGQDLFDQHGLDAAGLLDLLDDLPPAMVVGLEPTEDALQMHIAPIERDPRGILAGLFELVVPRSWQAVAVSVEGWADDSDTGRGPGDDPATEDAATDGPAAHEPAAHEPAPGDGVAIRALLTRSGSLSTRIDDAGVTDQVHVASAPDAPSGLLVDCLHRILGMATPGEPPDPVDVALGTWAQSMLQRLFDRGDLSWNDAVALHPGTPRAEGSPMGGRVVPSVETMVEATFRCTDDWDWARVHRRARRGSISAALSPAEAAWMDTTMYGRWVMSRLADPLDVADLLEGHDFCQVAAGLRAVVAGVEGWRDPVSAA